MADPWAAFRAAATGANDPFAEFRAAAQRELEQRQITGMNDEQLRAAAYVQPAPPPGVTIHTKEGSVYVDKDGKPVKTTMAEARARAEREFSGIGGDVRDSIVRGVPYVGEFLPRARAALTEGDYAQNLEREQAKAKTFDADHPMASLGGKVAGGIGGTVAALPIMAKAGVAGALSRIMLGGGGATPVGTVARGSVAGLLQGAAQGVGESADLTKTSEVGANAAKSGAFGGVLGALVPAGAAGAVYAKNAIANSNADALSSIPSQGVRFLQQQFDDPQALTAVQSRLRGLGPNAVMADASEEMLGIARGAAAIPGTRASVVDRLIARDAGKNARIGQAVDQNFGPAPIPSRIEASIREGQEALGPAYGQVMQGASAVNTQPIANTLDASAVNLRGPAQRAVNQVRGYLDIPGAPGNLDPNPQALFQTRQAIDGLLATEQNPQVIRQLTMARQQVDRELATAVPGIKDVDANFQELARQREALQRGGQVLDSGKTAVRPQELAEEVTQSANPQGLLVGPSAAPVRLRQGARAEIDRIIGTSANDVAKLNQVLKNEGDWNRDKLRTLFGQEKADRVLKVLDNERVMEATTRRVAYGSDTAQTRKFSDFLEQIGAPKKVETGLSIPGILAWAGRKTLDAAQRGRGEDNARQVADALARISVADGPQADAIIRSLMARNARTRNDRATYRAAGLLAAPTSPLLEVSGRGILDDRQRKSPR
jgi:hypothetical protein